MAHLAARLAVWWVFAAKSYEPVGRKTGGFHIFTGAFNEGLKRGLMPDGAESYARTIRKGAASVQLTLFVNKEYQRQKCLIYPVRRKSQKRSHIRTVDCH